MFRNKEVRRFAVLYAGLSAVAAIIGFCIAPAAGILLLAAAAASGAAFYAFTAARYREIAALSGQIDQVLHNLDQIFISTSEEGELAILQSEIAKMTLRIREQNSALQSEKAFLADSLADIAHQLRTPLTSINLILTLLPNAREEAEQKNLLREAEQLFLQMDWLLTALLQLSRLDAGVVSFQCETVDVRALLAAALRPVEIPMELHHVTCNLSMPDKLTLRGDFGWLSEALQNILKNCMESAGDGGQIEITCTDTALFTEIAIHDSGAGFAKEDLSNVFTRFYRGKHTGANGYGIGLALCRTIIAGQGGTITAKNHPAGGALFTIRFPK